MSDPTKRPLKVFLCHASADKPAVRKLHDYLKHHGVQPWLDENELLPGQNWREEIPKALDSSDVIVVCLSKNSVNKEGYVQKEISFALDKALEKPEGTIFIIPARLEECSVPSRLSGFHWVDLFKDNGYKQLLRSLNVRAANIGPNIAHALVTDETQPKVSRSTKMMIPLIGCSCIIIAATITAITSMIRPLPWPTIFSGSTRLPSPSPGLTLTLASPGSTVTLAPTPDLTTPDLTTPEGTTRAFLTALQQGEIEKAVSFISRYSIDFFNTTDGYIMQGFEESRAEWKELSYQPIQPQSAQQLTADTVHVIVQFKEGTFRLRFDCCVLRRENDQWRINLPGGGAADEIRSSLVDFRVLNPQSSEQTNRNVTVRLLRVVRYTTKLEIKYDIVNTNQDRCVFWVWGGGNNTLATYFGEQSKLTGSEITVRYQSTNNVTTTLGGYQDSYPTLLDFNGFELSNNSACEFPEGPPQPWTYRFELVYVQ